MLKESRKIMMILGKYSGSVSTVMIPLRFYELNTTWQYCTTKSDNTESIPNRIQNTGRKKLKQKGERREGSAT